MSQSMTRIFRMATALALVAASFGGGTGRAASEPSASPEAGHWPTGSELRASLETLGYAFSPGASGSPWTGDGFWTGGHPDILGSFTWSPERSVRLDGADDAPVTARLLVGADARLTQLVDVGTAVGASTSVLLEVSDFVRRSAVPGGATSCVFAQWPLGGGRIVLWRGGMLGAADVEVALEPLRDAQAVGTSPGSSPAPDDGIPASAEEACPTAGAGATAAPSTAPGPGPTGSAAITTVTIEAREFGFSPAAVTIPASGATRIVVKDAGRIVHNFTIDALGVQVVMSPGGSGEVTLVDLTPGTYQFYCSVSGHKEAGMVGTITVE
jgi:plastocyanin